MVIKRILFIILFVFLCVSVTSATTIKNDFNTNYNTLTDYNSSDVPRFFEKTYTTSYTYGSISGFDSSQVTQYSNNIDQNKYIFFGLTTTAKNSGIANGKVYLKEKETFSSISYFGFTIPYNYTYTVVKTLSRPSAWGEFKITLYNGGSIFGTSPNLQSYFNISSYSTKYSSYDYQTYATIVYKLISNDRYEIFYYSGTVYLYRNGELLGTSNGYSNYATNVGLLIEHNTGNCCSGLSSVDHYQANTAIIMDDIVIGDSASPGMLSRPPFSYYIMSSLSNPSLNAVYSNSNIVNSTWFKLQWNVGDMMTGQYTGNGTIITYFIPTNTIVDTYNFSLNDGNSIKYSGKYEMNITKTLISSGALTGRYRSRLLVQNSYVDEIKFMYINSGGTISWHRDTYVTGDVAYITSTISGFDIVNNSYYGIIYSDADSLIESYQIPSSSYQYATTLLSSKYTSGWYYIELVQRPKSGGNDSVIGYDFAYISSSTDTFNLEGGTFYGFQYVGAAFSDVFLKRYSDCGCMSNASVGCHTGGHTTTNGLYSDVIIAEAGDGLGTCPGGYIETWAVNGTKISGDGLPWCTVETIVGDVSDQITYFAFDLLDYNVSMYGSKSTGYVEGSYICFYDKNYNVVGMSGNLQSIFKQNHSGHRYEVFRVGTALHTYCNGVLVDDNGTISNTSYTGGFMLYSYDNNAQVNVNAWKVDNIEQHSPYGGGGITTFPAGWYVYKDLEDPALNGIYNGSSMMSGSLFRTSYSIGSNMDGYGSGATIHTVCLSTGETINTTTFTSGDISLSPSGYVNFNAYNMLVVSGAPYGLYKQVLSHAGKEIGSTTFAYISSGGSIYFDKDSYNVGDSAVVTSTIGSSFDLSKYDYYGRIYNENGVILDSWKIDAVNFVKTLDLSPEKYSKGNYYAFLLGIRKTDMAEIYISYDTAKISEFVIVSGYTWDAIEEKRLGGVTISTNQRETWRNTTSSVLDGSYNISGFVSRIPISFDAHASGYNFTQISITPLLSKSYNIDLYLIKDPVPANGTGIGGLVLTDNYKQAVPNATVKLSNSTWSDTKHTSSTGWFLFDSTSSTGDIITYSNISVIDSSGNVGKFSTIIPTQNSVLFSYYDQSNRELKYAIKSSSVTTGIIDNGTRTSYSNYLYVMDSGNNKLKIFDSNLSYISSIGSEGSGDDQFNSSSRISTIGNYNLDSAYVYVADTGNHRIVTRFANNLTYVSSFGSYGSGDDEFSSPSDVCIDPFGEYIWVVDTGNHRVVKRFASNYTYVNKVGTYGEGITNFSSPRGIDISPDGVYLVISDTGNNRIVKIFSENLTYVSSVGSLGASDNQFNSPTGVCIERNGEDVVYVTDTGNNRVVKRKLSDLSFLGKVGEYGSGINQFNSPRDIVSDGVYIYVADTNNSRIQKRYASDLSYSALLGSFGSGDTQFNSPVGISVILNGNYSVDFGVGTHASMDCDSSGNWYASYYDESNGDLNVAYNPASGYWHNIFIDSVGNVGKYSSLKYKNGNYSVAYYDETNGDLKFSYGNIVGSTTLTLDSSNNVGGYCSLYLTSGGEPRISYYDFTNGDLKFAYIDNNIWKNETIDSSGNVGLYTSIDCDAYGTTYVSYYDTTNGNLKLAIKNTSGLYIDAIDVNGDVGLYTSLDVGYDNTIYIAYYDATNGDLKLATKNTSGWFIETIDSNGDVGYYPSIKYDAYGKLHISYYDNTNKILKYFTRYKTNIASYNIVPFASYTLETTKDRYLKNTTVVFAPSYGNVSVYNIYLKEYYNLTVRLVDAKSNAPITKNVTVTLSNGESKVTDVGSVIFNLGFGEYSISAVSSSYVSTSSNVLVDADKEVTLYMTPIIDYSQSGLQYTIAPRNVRFVCIDTFGNRLSGIYVNATGYSTTLPDWGIFDVIFGWMTTYTNVSLTNDTMRGYTGSDGSIVFMMTESLQYKMIFKNESRGIEDTLVLYPKDDTYIITLGGTPFSKGKIEFINITLYSESIDSNITRLYASYIDPNQHTSELKFVVKNAKGETIYTTSKANLNNITLYYDVSHITGNQYTWGINATQSDYGNVSRYASVTLHSRLIELGIEDAYYNWISIIFLFILVSMFSGRVVQYGYVVVPLVAGWFYFIGWLEIGYLLITGIILLGILLWLSKRQFAGEGV